jgi:superfamily I DNA/RNA helicase
MDFKLTDEQQEIIQTDEDLKVNATAGSAKTTTSLWKIQELEKSIGDKEKSLYLVFNRSSKEHAKKLASESGIKKIQVDTAHSLAYRMICAPRKMKPTNGFSSYQLSSMLKISEYSGMMKFVLANHVDRFVRYYCNSSARNMDDYNYLKDIPVSDKERYEFVVSNLDTIRDYARKFYNMMRDKKCDCLHDFYLKEFHLSDKILNYPRIVFDEAQDASPVMLDTILRQKAKKTFVGDSNQSIYGFRKALDALEKVDFKNLNLSVSFRYPDRIAKIGKEILQWKKNFDPFFEVPDISGVGSSEKLDTHCVIGRTNSEIFFNIVTMVVEDYDYTCPYFEGGIHSYLKSDGGIHVYDVVNLKEGKKNLIKNKFIQNFDSYQSFQEYAKKSGDSDLSVIVRIVDMYGKKLFKIVKKLQQKEVDTKQKSDIVFSTVHKAKGLEYDRVTLLNDFNDQKVLEEKYNRLSSLERQDRDNIVPLLEEINMLYVAATRTKNELNQDYV